MILAIDPSLTNTAVVLGDAVSYRLMTFSSKNLGDSVVSRVQRCEQLVSSVIEMAQTHEIEAIFIEGYSFGSKGSGIYQIAEYGGLLRWHLVDLTERIFEVAPSTLKKFATGKGTGPKDMVAAHLAKRYGVLLEDNDSYDAFGLYQLGLVAEGHVEPANQAQKEAAAKAVQL